MAELNQNNIVDIIDVEQRHYQIIKEILARFLPYKKVLAYGSRVKWNASETSDLDLAVFNATEKEIYQVKEEFDESNIPFIIQILNWETIPQDFKENIERKYHILQKEDDWGIFKLGGVTLKITDGAHHSPKSCSTGFPMASVKDMEYNKINISNCRLISEKDYLKLVSNDCKPLIDDVLIAKDGSYLKHVFDVREEKEIVLLSSIAIMRPNTRKILPRYLKYVFLDPNFRSVVEGNYVSGAVIPRIILKDFKQLEIYLPPLPEQKAIAEILSSLDDKIDLLNRQNKTLENLAKTLFRHYFIDNAKDDWDSEEIGKYVTVVDNRGKTPPNQKETTPYPVIEVNALGKGDRLVDYSLIRKYVDKNTFENWFRTKPKKYDILVSTVGSVGEFSMFILEVGNIAQNVIALQAKELSPFYLYQVLKYKHEEVMNLDIGGVQPSIKVPHLLSIIIPIPEIEIQKEFDIQITEFVKKMETNYLQIQTLEKLRDTLLPKLISGDVRVNYKENE